MRSCTYHGRRVLVECRHLGGDEVRLVAGYSLWIDGVNIGSGPLCPDSPFGWGQDGEAAENLAHAILRQHTDSLPIADALRRRFAFEFVGTWGDEWSITAADLDVWVGQAIAAQGGEDASLLVNAMPLAEALANPRAFLEGMVETKKMRGVVRTYRGSRTDGEAQVNVTHVSDGDAVVYTLSTESPLLRSFLGSNGFNWGYYGTATEGLALAILLDATERIRVSKNNYEQFATEFVSKWPDRWEITSAEILNWLAANGGFLPRSTDHGGLL
jgi:hypothetical protein